jgi:thiamine pyrophosphate-dependent acetolactate synthase large subunit-like protein
MRSTRGEVGVCLATSGPGAIHLPNGLYDAKLDHQPVVAIVGQQSRMALGGSYQQEVDLVSLFKDVASEYVQMATHPAQIRHLVDRAVRIALVGRTVTCLIVPNDLASEQAVEAPPREHGTIHSGIGYTRPRVVPHDDELHRAAEILNAGEKVAILVGQGTLHATAEVIEVADLLGAGVAKALLGKAAVPDDLPFVTGSIGLLGTRPSYELMTGCDTLLMVGSSFPYSEFLPEEGKARGVQRAGGGRSPATLARAATPLHQVVSPTSRSSRKGWSTSIRMRRTNHRCPGIPHPVSCTSSIAASWRKRATASSRSRPCVSMSERRIRRLDEYVRPRCGTRIPVSSTTCQSARDTAA